MNISRRGLVSGATGIAAVSLFSPRGLFASSDDKINPELMPKDIMFASLIRAVDAAKSAGAEHVEASITRTLQQKLEQEKRQVTGAIIKNSNGTVVNIGVRVLIKGRWGHGSTNQFEGDELVRIATAACSQARANSKHRPREMLWIPAPQLVAEYITPGIDPFSVTQEEKIDFINSWRMAVTDYRNLRYQGDYKDCSITHSRTERAFINSTGSKLHSIVYNISANLPVVGKIRGVQSMSAPQPKRVKGLSMKQAGWEVMRESDAHLQIPDLIAESAEGSMIGLSPVDIGRYDVVCDAATVAGIITQTVVAGAEIDRAIGLEANAGGTSYLGPDLSASLGSLVGHEKLNVSINRTAKQGLATIPWDAEGVPEKTFSLIKGGKLVDFLTNREYAPLMNDWYSKSGHAIGSNGSASAASASSFPIVATGNVRIEPGSDQIGVEELVADVKRGYMMTEIGTSTSFQKKDGFMYGVGREIINGKLGSYVQLGALFNSTELLRNMTGIGGEKSVSMIGSMSDKGQPIQPFSFSIESVPMRFTDLAIIDPNKKI